MDDFKQIIEYCRLNFGKHISRKIRAKYKKDISLLKEQPYLGFEEPLLKELNLLQYHSLIIW